ncbi:hypothetical protein BN1723_002691 [Verticillium longisporum]|uniref:Cytokinesis regulator n=1 Tax=Verticillium longisporum TaxID=100787 RepID=A0A0G4LFJ8_VERLO|nr:hypothetical protein BN1723_002691 [Verticillium longisporum]
MESLRLKPRQPVEEQIEDWDDGDFQIDAGEAPFRPANSHNQPPSRRDSHSSVMSLRSELESLPGDERQLHLPGDDERSTLDAIAAATKAGIPIPQNVPSSALMGGTIKRLGGRKIKRIIQDDWENDLELPDSAQALRIKPQDASQFPDALRQVSGPHSSPTKLSAAVSLSISKDDRRQSTMSMSSVVSGAANLDKFKDNDDEDDDFFGDGGATIKVSKTRPPKPISLITPPTPQKMEKTDKIAGADDDFEGDFELPSDGKLKLSTRKTIPKTPATQAEDMDWGEGSLGTRFGGTRRDGRSNRSSSASALSPSVSSSFTAESEDDTFEGLLLPSGHVNFEERLVRNRKSRSPVRTVEEEPADLKTPQPQLQPQAQPQAQPAPRPPQAEADKDDMFNDLELGDGEVFDSGKLTLHRNIRMNTNRPASPTRPKTAVAITFTNKPVQSRLPRPNHERAQSSLEPVSESGGPIQSRSRRSQSRMGHSSHSSVTSLPTPTTPSPIQLIQPATPRRREMSKPTSHASLRNEPTTTSSQLLKFKRSLPAMRATPQSPAKAPIPRYERPPSRTDGRPQSSLRPKTPVERRAAGEPALQTARKPFLPAGSSTTHSHHISAKTGRSLRRHDSNSSIDLRPVSRTVSRSTMRSPSPQRLHRSANQIAQGGPRAGYYQNRSKTFGDGHELDAFDDLPTSSQAESKYVCQPAKAPLRNKIYQNVLPDRNTTPSPVPPSPARFDRSDSTPHFARDTAASRIARETSLAHRAPSNGPLAQLTTQRVAQLSSRNNFHPGVPQPTVRSKKHRSKPPQLKPHLITNMNKDNSSRHEKGMFYNPQTHRWEGNENALSAFDPPMPSPSTLTPIAHLPREKETGTPRPALITNITGTKNVQVVGGMVFDPQNMCWLKLDPQNKAKSESNDTMDGFNALDDDDDVFKDIPDLEDPPADSAEGGHGRVSDVKDDWLVGEEFDVGPEFVRRQREEEDRWRKKCEKWLDVPDRNRETWRWAIRDLLVHQRTTAQ